MSSTEDELVLERAPLAQYLCQPADSLGAEA